MTPGKQTFYCPRGCNVFDTNDEEPECAACGQIMITDPEPFHDAHAKRELEGIAECERKLKDGKKPR